MPNIPIQSWGREYVPWNSFYTTATGSTAVTPLWGEVVASSTYGFYPLHIMTTAAPEPVDIGYGPAGAERVVASGLTGFPLAVPGDLIPQGSRITARTAAGTGSFQVSGIRADKWAPDQSAAGTLKKTACPQGAAVTVTSATATLVAALPYPFVLTSVYIIGVASAGGDQTVTISVGPTTAEVPVWSTTIFRGDNTPRCFFDLKPRLLPIPAGARLSAKSTAHTYSIMTAGYRLDY